MCGAGEGRGHPTCVIRKLPQLLVQQIFVSFRDPPHSSHQPWEVWTLGSGSSHVSQWWWLRGVGGGEGWRGGINKSRVDPCRPARGYSSPLLSSPIVSPAYSVSAVRRQKLTQQTNNNSYFSQLNTNHNHWQTTVQASGVTSYLVVVTVYTLNMFRSTLYML